MTAFPPPNQYFNGIIYDSDYFVSSSTGSGLTISQANTRYLQKTIPDTAVVLETFQAGIQTDLIKSNGGSGGTIYTDPAVFPAPQTYSTLVCQNNETCSFGGSSGICNLGGLSTGVNIGFNMPSGYQITIATAGVQDTNVLIATKGAIITGTNKVQIGAATNALNVASGTITLGTGNSAISVGAYSLQTSNILIGTKGAVITGTDKIVIGGATNTLSLSSGTINLNNPLTVGYTYPVSSTSQIGHTTTHSTLSSTLSSAIMGAQFNVFTDVAIPAGVWNISYWARLRTSGTSTITTYSTWGLINGVNDPFYGQNGSSSTQTISSGTNSFFIHGAFVYASNSTFTANVVVYMLGSLSGTVSAATASNFIQYTRIA